jgi:RNA polymerase-binding protein DksA
MRGVGSVDEKEMQKFKEELLKEKERLQSELKYVNSTMEQSQSEWTGDEQYQNHLADQGTETFMRESDLSLARNIRDIIARIDDSLRRMDEGTYGICRVCGRPIEKERLEAVPYTDLCIEDKIKEEKSW